MWATFPIFLEPLLTEFGWTRAATSGAFSLYLIVCAVVGIPMGRLTDKFGPKILIVICGLIFGLGYILTSQISAIWQLYIFYGVLLGIGCTDWIPTLSTVTRWFVKRRGLMVGIASSAWGLSIFIMPALSVWLISTYGWRNSFVIIGITTAVFIIGAAQFLKRDPSQMGLSPYGANEVKERNLDLQFRGLSLRQAMYTRQLWLLCGVYSLFLLSYAAYAIHIILYTTEQGISLASAANILVISGAVSFPAGIMLAGASDRIGGRLALTISCTLLLVASLWLQLASELWMFYLFAVIFGFAYGGFFALVPTVPAELFGLRAHGAVLGFISLGGMVGQAVGPVLAGYLFDVTGSYQSAFLLSIGATALSLTFALFLRPITSEKYKR